MKKVVFTILKFVLFLIVFFAGSLFPPLHFEHILIATPGVTRIFVADGILLMFALYVLIIVIEIMRKRSRTSRSAGGAPRAWSWTLASSTAGGTGARCARRRLRPRPAPGAR